MGEVDNMYVVEFDKTFKGVWVGTSETNERYHSFDMNSDGFKDFRLISLADTVSNSTSTSDEMSYAVYIELEDHYGSKLQNTDDLIYYRGTERNTVYTGSGSNATYWVYNYNCNQILNSIEHFEHSYVNIVNADDVISSTNDEEWFNMYNRRLIYHSNFTEFSGQTYSSYEFDCLNSSKNSLIYIPIQLSSNSSAQPKLGWIELEISEDNTIHLIRTAIQE
jgi:hypothetical protein